MSEHPDWHLQSEFDGMVRGTFARATKTFRAGTLLVKDGFGPQAAMLARSLFEDMVVAYWMVHVSDEDWVVRRLGDQWDHGRLLLDRTITTHEATFHRDEDLVLRDREDLLGDLERFRATFGEYGDAFWWARDIEPADLPNPAKPYTLAERRTFNDLVNSIADVPELKAHWRSFLGPDVTDAEAEARPSFLRVMFDLAQQYNNQLLHHTSYALSQTGDGTTWDDDRSDEWIEQIPLTLYWTYGQLVLLMCDRFDSALKEEFEPLFHATATAAFRPSPPGPQTAPTEQS